MGATKETVSLDGSQSQLLDNTPAHTQQYLATFAATLGNFAVGCILAYSSPISGQLLVPSNETKSDYNSTCGGELTLSLTDEEFSWFSSIVNVGAMTGAAIGGLLISNLGRRSTLVASAIPFILGWLLIGFANTFPMLISGRVVVGLCCGLVSLTVPTYIGEIASPDIRGGLAGTFQLMATIGFVYVYAIGPVICWQVLTLVCLAPALIFAALMVFNPESPAFLVAKGRDHQAKKSLQHFRGKDYNVQPELDRLRDAEEDRKSRKVNMKDFIRPNILKPFSISLATMFFQQASGINAILFNLDTIFQSADSNLSSSASSIIVAVMQTVMTAVAALLMDRAGRKLLLMVSSGLMCLSLIAMGTYFYLADTGSSAADSLGWLPLASLMVYISAFSLGYGPIPWVLMGEMFSADIREAASSVATITNWGFAFIITLLFYPLTELLGSFGVYWLYAGICGINFVFCFLFVKETKGKTLEEITAMFGN